MTFSETAWSGNSWLRRVAASCATLLNVLEEAAAVSMAGWGEKITSEAVGRRRSLERRYPPKSSFCAVDETGERRGSRGGGEGGEGEDERVK